MWYNNFWRSARSVLVWVVHNGWSCSSLVISHLMQLGSSCTPCWNWCRAHRLESGHGFHSPQRCSRSKHCCRCQQVFSGPWQIVHWSLEQMGGVGCQLQLSVASSTTMSQWAFLWPPHSLRSTPAAVTLPICIYSEGSELGTTAECFICSDCACLHDTLRNLTARLESCLVMTTFKVNVLICPHAYIAHFVHGPWGGEVTAWSWGGDGPHISRQHGSMRMWIRLGAEGNGRTCHLEGL